MVVNDELRVPRTLRRKLRAIIHNCGKHGVESQSGGNPAFLSHLRGLADYIYMVHPEEGARLRGEIDALASGA